MDVMELDTTEMDVLITDLEVHDGLPLSRVISDVFVLRESSDSFSIGKCIYDKGYDCTETDKGLYRPYIE